MNTPYEIFLSYAHKDEEWKDKLEEHLSALKRQGIIHTWHDRQILPGAEWAQEINAHLNTASILLLLISPAFINSDYCWSVELQQAIERHNKGEASVIPIIVRPTHWHDTPFAKLQALPKDGKAISTWSNEDEAFLNTLASIRTLIKTQKENSIHNTPQSTSPHPTVEQKIPINKNPWYIPFHRNPFFTGREDILTQLHTILHTNPTATLSQPVAISGLGGIGKTQTAIEYAYRYKDDYQTICWVQCGTPEELSKDFAFLVEQLDLVKRPNQEHLHLIDAVKKWFETHTHWLLIFDNADDLEGVYRYLPQSNAGHIIITTRAHAMSGIANKIEIKTMDLEEGTHFLLHRAGLIRKDPPSRPIIETELHITHNIINELGGLPLALDQAGAYLEETGASLTDYLQLSKQQQADLLKRRGGGKYSDHVPVATTWSLALHKIEQTNPSTAPHKSPTSSAILMAR